MIASIAGGVWLVYYLLVGGPAARAPTRRLTWGCLEDQSEVSWKKMNTKGLRGFGTFSKLILIHYSQIYGIFESMIFLLISWDMWSYQEVKLTTQFERFFASRLKDRYFETAMVRQTIRLFRGLRKIWRISTWTCLWLQERRPVACGNFLKNSSPGCLIERNKGNSWVPQTGAHMFDVRRNETVKSFDDLELHLRDRYVEICGDWAWDWVLFAFGTAIGHVYICFQWWIQMTSKSFWDLRLAPKKFHRCCGNLP